MSLVSCLPVGRQVSRLLLLRDLGTFLPAVGRVLGTSYNRSPECRDLLGFIPFFPLLLRHELLIR